VQNGTVLVKKTGRVVNLTLTTFLTVSCTRAVLTLCSIFQVEPPAISSSSNHASQVSSIQLINNKSFCLEQRACTVLQLNICYALQTRWTPS